MPEEWFGRRCRSATLRRKTCQIYSQPDRKRCSYSGANRIPRSAGHFGLSLFAAFIPAISRERVRTAQVCRRSLEPNFDRLCLSQCTDNKDMVCPSAGDYPKPKVSRLRPRVGPQADPCMPTVCCGRDRRSRALSRRFIIQRFAPRESLVSHPFFADGAIRSALPHPASFARAIGGSSQAGAAPQRVPHAQQNAYRCFPPGGNPGGRATRQPSRGIRLRISG